MKYTIQTVLRTRGKCCEAPHGDKYGLGTYIHGKYRLIHYACSNCASRITFAGGDTVRARYGSSPALDRVLAGWPTE